MRELRSQQELRYSHPAVKTRFAVYATSLTWVLASVAAHSNTPVTPDRTGAEIGLIGIECVPETGTGVYRFRGVVIDTAAADIPFDVILTTAHGFPADAVLVAERCQVRGPEEREYRIDAIWRPDARGRGMVDDWAVLVTERRLRGRMERQPIRALRVASRRQPEIAETPVRLPLRFFGAERACTLEPRGGSGENLDVGLFSHTCRAWPGHSGSPILTADGGDVFVVGIHVGSRWLLEQRASYRIGRFVDATILEAIQAATGWRQ